MLVALASCRLLKEAILAYSVCMLRKLELEQDHGRARGVHAKCRSRRHEASAGSGFDT
jgi:hypothetical protein